MSIPFRSIVLSLTLLSCAFAPPPYYYFPDEQGGRYIERREQPARQQISTVQQRLYDGAMSIRGAEELYVGGRRFTMDCSGTVSAIYYSAGFDLTSLYEGYTGRGTERMYNALRDRNLLETRNRPQVGDLIFWDDTYDSNNNGLWDDKLTHVGMVVAVHPDGGVDYIHEHVSLGIVIEHMNLSDPDTWKKTVNGREVVVNSPMRMNSNSTMDRWLASHHFRAFGQAHRLISN